MAIIKKHASILNLTNYQTFINDDVPLSRYFRITEFSDTFTGGKNGFLIEGSEHLKETTEIKLEVLDVNGNPVYVEPDSGVPEYYEGLSKLVAVYVYDDTPIGIGKITILGELKTYVDTDGSITDVPSEWSGVYNVKWERDFKINKILPNEDRVRFYQRPLVTITELVKSIITKNIPSVTQTGSVQGIPELPITGTNYNDWHAGTLYNLTITDSGTWSSSIDEHSISIPSLNYTPTVKEVLNDKSILVDTPYTSSNLVSTFDAAPYTITFEDTDSQTVSDSAITGSFAHMKFTNLKTFVGDIARVKVYRKSRNEPGDYQFTQDIKLESTELLRDLESATDTEVSYGNFSTYNLNTYWVTSSNDSPVTINTDILQSSVKIDYNTITDVSQSLITSNTYEIATDLEYTLSFKTLLSGSVSTGKSLRAFLSSSNYMQEITTIPVDNSYLQRVDVSENIISDQTDDMNLVFETSGDDWYISNVSLRNSQETSFSPDEFILVQEVPRKLSSETFDFKFEFYDINNNYIPVEVKSSKEFTGGNTSDLDGTSKVLSFEANTNIMRFTSGSLGNPLIQQIGFVTTVNLYTGSVTYASSAYDSTGSYIDPVSYSGTYPGTLTNPSNVGATLTIANFTGSEADVLVGSIVYTASIEDAVDYESVYRFDEGDSSAMLLVTSNANQFIYEPTTLSLKPTGQSLTVRASRKNLGSLTNTITVNSSSNVPLTDVSDINGIKTYSLAGSNFPYASGEVTYEFSGSDTNNNEYSDEITVSPVMNFDGISIGLSNESTSLVADSTGYVSAADFDEGDGTVSMNIGSNVITHEDGLSTPNRFDILSITGSGCTPNDVTPSANSYGISAMSVISASLDMNIRYKAGDGTTLVDFRRRVNYTKARKAAPLSLITANPQSQGVTYDGATYGTPLDVITNVNEGGTDYSYNETLTTNTYKITNVTSGSNSGGTVTPTTPVNEDGTSGVITISYQNSEDTVFTGKIINFDVGVASKGATGNSGPGIVHRGDWSGSVSYKYTDVAGTSRRDTVIYGGTYYATTAAHTSTNDTDPGTGYPGSGPWDSLGTDSLFVAAEIMISQESFVQNTLNVGTNASGSAANIVIAGGSTSPYMAIGQTSPAYDVNGIWLGVDSGAYKLSLKSATAALKWDGTDLSITGSVNASSGIIGGWEIGTTYIRTSESEIILSNAGTITLGTTGHIKGGQTAYNTGSGFFLGHSSGNYKFSIGDPDTNNLTWDGTDLTLVGDVTIGSDDAIFLANSSGISLGNAEFTNAPFSVNLVGEMSASEANIGGWTVDTDSIHAGTKYPGSGSFTETSGDITILSDGSIHTPMFYVDSAGNSGFKGSLVNSAKDDFRTTDTVYSTLDKVSEKPKMTVSASDPSGPVTGDLHYHTSLAALRVWTGASWTAV
jgi:hypothetical protein